MVLATPGTDGGQQEQGVMLPPADLAAMGTELRDQRLVELLKLVGASHARANGNEVIERPASTTHADANDRSSNRAIFWHTCRRTEILSARSYRYNTIPQRSQ